MLYYNLLVHVHGYSGNIFCQDEALREAISVKHIQVFKTFGVISLIKTHQYNIISFRQLVTQHVAVM